MSRSEDPPEFSYIITIRVEDEDIYKGECPVCMMNLTRRARVALALRCASRPVTALELSIETETPQPTVRRELAVLGREGRVVVHDGRPARYSYRSGGVA